MSFQLVNFFAGQLHFKKKQSNLQYCSDKDISEKNLEEQAMQSIDEILERKIFRHLSQK